MKELSGIDKVRADACDSADRIDMKAKKLKWLENLDQVGLKEDNVPVAKRNGQIHRTITITPSFTIIKENDLPDSIFDFSQSESELFMSEMERVNGEMSNSISNLRSKDDVKVSA